MCASSIFLCRRKRKWDQPAEGVLAAAGVVPGLLPVAAAGAFAGLGATPNSFPYMNYFPGMSSPALQSGAAVQSSPTTVQQNAAAIVQKFNQVTIIISDISLQRIGDVF